MAMSPDKTPAEDGESLPEEEQTPVVISSASEHTSESEPSSPVPVRASDENTPSPHQGSPDEANQPSVDEAQVDQPEHTLDGDQVAGEVSDPPSPRTLFLRDNRLGYRFHPRN